jgi:hypothetical protein
LTHQSYSNMIHITGRGWIIILGLIELAY